MSPMLFTYGSFDCLEFNTLMQEFVSGALNATRSLGYEDYN
jgi:hypothetical protein